MRMRSSLRTAEDKQSTQFTSRKVDDNKCERNENSMSGILDFYLLYVHVDPASIDSKLKLFSQRFTVRLF